MAGHPPDSPEFLCGICSQVMCEDCQSIAAEYEYLYRSQKLALINAHERIKELETKLKIAENRAKRYEEVSKMGYQETICGYIDWLASYTEVE